MRGYQRSLLEQQEAFLPMIIPMDHEMVILSNAIDWDLGRAIAEVHRNEKVHSTRG